MRCERSGAAGIFGPVCYQRALKIFVVVCSCLSGFLAAAEPTAPPPRRMTVGLHLVSIPEIDEPAERFTAIC